MIRLEPRSHRIMLEDLEVAVDIGFHDFEIGTPQRVAVTVEATIDFANWPKEDSRSAAWDYDFIRTGIKNLVDGRRYNLQETFAEDIFRFIASRPGVLALTIKTRKMDVYPDAHAVGVILSSD